MSVAPAMQRAGAPSSMSIKEDAEAAVHAWMRVARQFVALGLAKAGGAEQHCIWTRKDRLLTEERRLSRDRCDA